jgi:hypothetical protein
MVSDAAGHYPAAAQAADRAWLQSHPLAGGNLPTHYDWGLIDPAALPKGGDPAGLVPSVRAAVSGPCVDTTTERIASQSGIFEAKRGIVFSDVTIGTQSTADAERAYRDLTTESSINCLADATADVKRVECGPDPNHRYRSRPARARPQERSLQVQGY